MSNNQSDRKQPFMNSHNFHLVSFLFDFLHSFSLLFSLILSAFFFFPSSPKVMPSSTKTRKSAVNSETESAMRQSPPEKEPEPRRYPCKWDDCPLIFNQEIQVYEHVASEHNTSGKSNCKWRKLEGGPFCNVLFKHRNMLREHAVAHFTNQLKFFILT